MFGIKRQDAQLNTITLNIDGMHCVSCAMNIDGELEELDGVSSANTNYAKGITVISYDSEKASIAKLTEVIEGLGYRVTT